MGVGEVKKVCERKSEKGEVREVRRMKEMFAYVCDRARRQERRAER